MFSFIPLKKSCWDSRLEFGVWQVDADDTLLSIRDSFGNIVDFSKLSIRYAFSSIANKSFPVAPLFQFISRWKRNGYSIWYKYSQGWAHLSYIFIFVNVRRTFRRDGGEDLLCCKWGVMRTNWGDFAKFRFNATPDWSASECSSWSEWKENLDDKEPRAY